MKKLYTDYRVSTRNCVDLSLLARSVDNEQWKGKYSMPLGLARLVEAYQDRLLLKERISRSDWESVLNSAQRECLFLSLLILFFGTNLLTITDASNDAHAGYVIYNTLLMKGQLMTTIPKPVYYTFDAVRGRLCEPSGMYWCAFNPEYDPGPPSKRPKEGERNMNNSLVSPLVKTSSTLPLNQATGVLPLL